MGVWVPRLEVIGIFESPIRCDPNVYNRRILVDIKEFDEAPIHNAPLSGDQLHLKAVGFEKVIVSILNH
jgi:hypothetical protein